MGYRSHVVLAIGKELLPFFMLRLSQNKEAEALVFSHADEFDRDYQGDKSWLIRWDSIKWYEMYEDIQTLEKFIQEASSDEYDSLGGYLYHAFGRIPETGESIECGNAIFRIRSASARKIQAVEVSRGKMPTEDN